MQYHDPGSGNIKYLNNLISSSHEVPVKLRYLVMLKVS